MIINGWNIKQIVSMTIGLLALSSVGAQNTNCMPSEKIDTCSHQHLDFRSHRGYEGWERSIPTHVKLQYAGGMGFMSFGVGWDYGRKCRWETDILIGILPKVYSDQMHMTFTFKQNYIPWSIRCCDQFTIEPFSCGIYFNLITGENYWMREPDKYPGDSYYGFSTRLRTHLYIGQRVAYYLKNKSILQHITLYYELSANDLDILAKCGNKSLNLSDIVFFSVGIKFQLLKQ